MPSRLRIFGLRSKKQNHAFPVLHFLLEETKTAESVSAVRSSDSGFQINAVEKAKVPRREEAWSTKRFLIGHPNDCSLYQSSFFAHLNRAVYPLAK